MNGFSTDFVMCMQHIKYLNLVQTSPVDLEKRWAENSNLVVLVNNIPLYHTSSLAADMRPCSYLDED